MSIRDEIQEVEDLVRVLQGELAAIREGGVTPDEEPLYAEREAEVARLDGQIRELRAAAERNVQEWESRAAERRELQISIAQLHNSDAADDPSGLNETLQAAEAAAADYRHGEALRMLNTVAANIGPVAAPVREREAAMARRREEQLEVVADDVRARFPDLSDAEVTERAQEIRENPRLGYQGMLREQSDDALQQSTVALAQRYAESGEMTMARQDAYQALGGAVDELVWRARSAELSAVEFEMDQDEIDRRNQEIADALADRDLPEWQRERLQWERTRLTEANTTWHERFEEEQNRIVIGSDGVISTQAEHDHRMTARRIQTGLNALTDNTTGGILAGFTLAQGGTEEQAQAMSQIGGMFEAGMGHHARSPGEVNHADAAARPTTGGRNLGAQRP